MNGERVRKGREPRGEKKLVSWGRPGVTPAAVGAGGVRGEPTTEGEERRGGRGKMVLVMKMVVVCNGPSIINPQFT